MDYVITDEENLIDDMTYNVPLGKLPINLITGKGIMSSINEGVLEIDWNKKLNEMEYVKEMWTVFKEEVNNWLTCGYQKRRLAKEERPNKNG